MSVGLAFFHGWGLDRHFWQPLAKALPQYPHTFFDAGYFGEPTQPDWQAATQWVGIGHSMGWVHALETPPPSGWAGLVSIGGFAHFCVRHTGDPGQAGRVVDRMVRVFERSPQDVLRDFLDRCGLSALMPRDGVEWHTTRLAVDLARLAKVDVSDLLAAQTTPILALAAQDDVIVSPELTLQTFAARPNTQLLWQAIEGHTIGHALGHAQAQACAQSIQAFLQLLDHGQGPHQP